MIKPHLEEVKKKDEEMKKKNLEHLDTDDSLRNHHLVMDEIVNIHDDKGKYEDLTVDQKPLSLRPFKGVKMLKITQNVEDGNVMALEGFLDKDSGSLLSTTLTRVTGEFIGRRRGSGVC